MYKENSHPNVKMPKEFKELIAEKYTYYQKRRDKIDKASDDHSITLDTTIITIASGSILLTITFYEKLTSNLTTNIFWLLKGSWIALLISIIAVLTSYKFALKSFKIGTKKLDNWILDTNAIKGPKLNNKWGTASEICNSISYIFLIIGIILVMIFACISVNN